MAAQDIIGAGDPSGAPSGAPEPQDDAYSQMLGQSGGNPLSRFATRFLNARTGRDIEIMKQAHDDRARQADILFKIGATAAEQGLPLGEELGGAYKKLGGNKETWDALTAYGQQKQQAAQQADQQELSMLRLNPDMSDATAGPAAGAGGAAGGMPNPSTVSGVTPAPAGGPPSMGDAGPNAGLHHSDPAFDWQHYAANEPPEIKDLDYQMRVTMFRLSSAERRGLPTAGLKAQLDDLAKQHQSMFTAYLNMGKEQYTQSQENARSQNEINASNARTHFEQGEEDKRLERGHKLEATQQDIKDLNDGYTKVGDDIAKNIAGGTGTKALTDEEKAAFVAQAKQRLAALDQRANDLGVKPQGKYFLPKLQPAVAGTGLRGAFGYGTPSKEAAIMPDTGAPSRAASPPEFIVNPKTGERRRYVNGKYVPVTQTASK